MKMQIKVNHKELRVVQERLGSFSKKAPTVISRAINRAASSIQSNAVKLVREKYIIKSGDVKGTIKITKATTGRLGAVVRSDGKLIGLDHFKVSPKQARPERLPKVLKAAVKKGSAKAIVGAFVANINGDKVFKRTSDDRLPIQKLMGPSVPQMIDQEGIRKQIDDASLKVYNDRINHEINQLLKVKK